MRSIESFAIFSILSSALTCVLGCTVDDSCEAYSNCPITAGAGGLAGAGGTGGTGGAGGSGADGGNCDLAKSPSEEACLISDEHGVFVSPLGDDTSGDGSQANPYKTLGKAIDEAGSASKHVFACDDGTEYSETATLVLGTSFDGLGMFGGFDCTTWGYSTTKKSKLSGAASAIRIENVAGSVRVEDFDIVAADGGTNGESSIGVYVASSQGVGLTRTSITAGNGAAGGKGQSFTTAAATGASGNGGVNACSTANPGGNEVESQCDGGASGSKGGKGGDGGSATGAGVSGNAGVVGAQGQPGAGESVALWGCTVGGTLQNGLGNGGSNGGPGSVGPGGSGAGTLAASGYTPANGSAGQPGQPGQGGGGGGGAKAPTTCSGGPSPATGASGGSGGGGGCGGKGGGAGGGGGASIALASVSSNVALTDVTLVAKSGGTGGDGGTPQAGGDGGTPGSGGTKNGTLANNACAGGMGGSGGNGGPGGGGAGGPSIGLAYSGTKPAGTPSITAATTAAGGGADGLGMTTGTGAGASGVFAKEQSF